MADPRPVDSLLARLSQIAPYATGPCAFELCDLSRRLIDAVRGERYAVCLQQQRFPSQGVPLVGAYGPSPQYHVQNSGVYHHHYYGGQPETPPVVAPQQMYPNHYAYYGPPIHPTHPVHPTPGWPPLPDQARIIKVEFSQTSHRLPESMQSPQNDKSEAPKESGPPNARTETLPSGELVSASDVSQLGLKAEPDSVNKDEGNDISENKDIEGTRYPGPVASEDIPNDQAVVLASVITAGQKRKSSEETKIDLEQPTGKAIKTEAGEEQSLESPSSQTAPLQQNSFELMPQCRSTDWSPSAASRPIVMSEAWQACSNSLSKRTAVQADTPSTASDDTEQICTKQEIEDD